LHQPYLAEKSYKTALAINPNDYNTHYNLGELYYTLFGDPKKALEEFKNTVQLKSNHVDANFKIGLISLENNLEKEAVTYFNKALQDAPNNTRIMMQLAVAYEKLGMQEDAVRVYQTILSYDALNDIALQKIKLLGK
jgi:Tfp pilus assembly protein PilF